MNAHDDDPIAADGAQVVAGIDPPTEQELLEHLEKSQWPTALDESP